MAGIPVTPPIYVPVVLQTTESKDLLTQIAALLGGIASILWVVFAFFCVWLFRAQIRHFLDNLKKWKGFGQELEIGEKDVAELHEETEKLKVQVEAEPPEPAQAGMKDLAPRRDSLVSDIVKQAAQSPIATLMILGREIEIELRRVLASLGSLNYSRPSTPLTQGVSILNRYGWMKDLLESAQKFQLIRNAVVHGRIELPATDIASAIDSGATILSALRNLPRNHHMVAAVDIPLYSDANCTTVMHGVLGLLVLDRGPDGVIISRHLLPIRTAGRYAAGTEVSWEFDISDSINQHAWYHDPETNECMGAFASALIFIGRNLEEI